MPRSPWTASAGCRNTAAVPVLHSVAAMVRAMCPDLPIPVTTTLPGCARIRSTARISWPFNRPAARATDAASISMAARARASHSCLACSGGMGNSIIAWVRALAASRLPYDQSRNLLEMADVFCRDLEAELQSGRSDQQIFERKRDTAFGFLAGDGTRALGDLDGDRVDGHSCFQFLDERLPHLAVRFQLGTMDTVG